MSQNKSFHSISVYGADLLNMTAHSWTDAFSSCSCLLLAVSGLSVSKDQVSEEIEHMGSEEEHNGF